MLLVIDAMAWVSPRFEGLYTGLQVLDSRGEREKKSVSFDGGAFWLDAVLFDRAIKINCSHFSSVHTLHDTVASYANSNTFVPTTGNLFEYFFT